MTGKLTAVEPVKPKPQLDRPRLRWSLVPLFQEQMESEWSVDRPEPDFFKWVSVVGGLDSIVVADKPLEELSSKDREAWETFRDALKSVLMLQEFRDREPAAFRRVARQLNLLPTFAAWHPDAEPANRKLLRECGLGHESLNEFAKHPQHAAQQSPAVRYAYTLIGTIDLTLDNSGDELERWGELYGFGVRHDVAEEVESCLAKMALSQGERAKLREHHRGAYRILPLWTRDLLKLERPFGPGSVRDYWRIAKALIREEMPRFHERPEWRAVRDRHYSGGAKPGAIQNAIFKDIRKAMETIAGSHRRRRAE